MTGWRRQPPVYSPLSIRAVVRAASVATHRGSHARAELGAALCRQYRADSAWLLGSGTQALQLALELSGAAIGERAPIVALPAFGCFDIATAAVGAGPRVTFYDIDPATLAPEGDSLRRALHRDRAQIVVVSPLYGIPADWDAVSSLAAEYGALVIEDAAQGLGASWRGDPLGSLAPLSVLSFGRGKGWTGGRGGALLLRFPAPHPRQRLRNGGPMAEVGALLRALAQSVFGEPSWYGLPASIPGLGLGSTRYRRPRPVRTMTRAAAAMLLETRGAAEAEMAVRRMTGERLLARAVAANISGLVVPPPGAVAGYLRFPIRRLGGLRDLPSRERALRLGVAPSYPTPLTSLRPLRPLQLHHGDRCHGAEELASGLITLPTHSRLTGQEFHELQQLLAGRDRPGKPHAAAVVRALGECEMAFDGAPGTPSSRS